MAAGAWRAARRSIDFTTDSGSGTQITRDGTKIVLDILSPKTDAPPMPQNRSVAARRLRSQRGTKTGGAHRRQSGERDCAGRRRPRRRKRRKAGASASEPKRLRQARPPTGLAAGSRRAPAAPSPRRHRRPAEARRARTPDGVTLNFPGGRTVAAFIRANTAWIAVEGGRPSNVAALQSQLGDFPASSWKAQEWRGQRGAHRAETARADRRAIRGEGLAVTLGAACRRCTWRSSTLVRNDDDPRHPALAAAVPGSAHEASKPIRWSATR